MITLPRSFADQAPLIKLSEGGKCKGKDLLGFLGKNELLLVSFLELANLDNEWLKGNILFSKRLVEVIEIRANKGLYSIESARKIHVAITQGTLKENLRKINFTFPHTQKVVMPTLLLHSCSPYSRGEDFNATIKSDENKVFIRDKTDYDVFKIVKRWLKAGALPDKMTQQILFSVLGKACHYQIKDLEKEISSMLFTEFSDDIPHCLSIAFENCSQCLEEMCMEKVQERMPEFELKIVVDEGRVHKPHDSPLIAEIYNYTKVEMVFGNELSQIDGEKKDFILHVLDSIATKGTSSRSRMGKTAEKGLEVCVTIKDPINEGNIETLQMYAKMLGSTIGELTLDVSGYTSGDEVAGALDSIKDLLSSCPTLKKLVIKGYCCFIEDDHLQQIFKTFIVRGGIGAIHLEQLPNITCKSIEELLNQKGNSLREFTYTLNGKFNNEDLQMLRKNSSDLVKLHIEFGLNKPYDVSYEALVAFLNDCKRLAILRLYGSEHAPICIGDGYNRGVLEKIQREFPNRVFF